MRLVKLRYLKEAIPGYDLKVDCRTLLTSLGHPNNYTYVLVNIYENQRVRFIYSSLNSCTLCNSVTSYMCTIVFRKNLSSCNERKYLICSTSKRKGCNVLGDIWTHKKYCRSEQLCSSTLSNNPLLPKNLLWQLNAYLDMGRMGSIKYQSVWRRFTGLLE